MVRLLRKKKERAGGQKEPASPRQPSSGLGRVNDGEVDVSLRDHVEQVREDVLGR